MLDKEEKEIWKTYPEFDFIEASNLGRVRTKDRYVRNGKGMRLVKGQILKQQQNKNGYMCVNFRVNGKRVHLLVHRICATCFIPNPDNFPEVNHIDNDRTNNNVNNFEWCTSQYNIAYREKYGTPAKEFTKELRKPVIAVNLETKEVLRFESQCEASRKLKANLGNINNVLKGRRKKTHGYWFCYADERAIKKTREKFGDKVANEVEKLLNDKKKKTRFIT